MEPTGRDVGPFRGVTTVRVHGGFEICRGTDEQGRRVTILTMGPSAVEDDSLRGALTEAYQWARAHAPAGEDFAGVELSGDQPWVASLDTPGTIGVRGVFDRLVSIVRPPAPGRHTGNLTQRTDTGSMPRLGPDGRPVSAAADRGPGTDTGSIPRVTSDTGPLPQVSADTGSMPRATSDTGAIPRTGGSRTADPRTGRTGAMPRTTGDTGSMPRVTGDTGAVPRTTADTGSIPRVTGDTGSMPRVAGGAGPVPRGTGGPGPRRGGPPGQYPPGRGPHTGQLPRIVDAPPNQPPPGPPPRAAHTGQQPRVDHTGRPVGGSPVHTGQFPRIDAPTQQTGQLRPPMRYGRDLPPMPAYQGRPYTAAPRPIAPPRRRPGRGGHALPVLLIIMALGAVGVLALLVAAYLALAR